MTIVDRLSSDIWDNQAFQSDFGDLSRANILKQLGIAGNNGSAALARDCLKRLFQCAMVFADSESEIYHDAAQRISTAGKQLLDDDDTLSSLFSLIQGRLRNFPSLSLNDSQHLKLSEAPLSMQFEFIGLRESQTIQLGKDSYVLTPFQLLGWNKLATQHSATLTGPTSAGKSYIILLYLRNWLAQNQQGIVAYLVPTRALINQVADDVQRQLTDQGLHDVLVSSVPVDLTQDRRLVVYVVTQERLEALFIASPKLKLDVVVVDEAQIISSGPRGVLLESVVDRIILANPTTQFIFSGPLIENPSYFSNLFGLSDFEVEATTRSPITQNVILLNYKADPDYHVSVQLYASGRIREIADVPLPIRLESDADKLSYLSLFFGKNGSSIVYCAGRAEAEKIAIKISQEATLTDETENNDVSELIDFVRTHIHPDYALVGTLRSGVGFHYGFMPPLLRRELERHFKERKLGFMVCTSTLLYGLNLPARNIFMLKPKTGRDTDISGPDFWNLAGRAGRLGKELEGNIFLIDYDTWNDRLLDSRPAIHVESALEKSIVRNPQELLAFISDETVPSEKQLEMEIVLGKLITDEKAGNLGRTINRYSTGHNASSLTDIAATITTISSEIDLPSGVLDANIGVSVFRQRDLFAYFTKRLQERQPSEIIPRHPLGDFKMCLDSYRRAFRRIHTYLLNYKGSDKRHLLFSSLALRWMRGDPLPVLIDSTIAYNKKQNTGKSTATLIRETLENIEENLRFRYVKFFTCYNSLLTEALERANLGHYASSVPNVALYLEMGASSGAMINLMALGLSRTSAESLADYITDKDMGVESLRAWLRNRNFAQLDISPICVREIENVVRNIA